MKKLWWFVLGLFFAVACSKNGDVPMVPDPPLDGGGVGNPVQATITPCENGMAGDYPCNGYDLIGQIPLGTFNATEGNDSWGWTDTTTGREYAIMGLDNGTAFVDITDETDLIYLGKLATATENSSWRDIKVYKDHAFIVSEADAHGMQVFDLTRLRNVTSPPESFTADARYTGFGNAHNIVINEETGFAYAVGTSTFNGGPHFVDIQDPKNPLAAGGYDTNGYSHDAQVVIYDGPDMDHFGKEILFAANENDVGIVDVTDKDNPTEIMTTTYPSSGYTHQGWLTEDHRYFFVGDELDEVNFGFNTRTLIFDFTDLDNPVLHDTYFGPTSAIDHNGYVKGNTFYLANYTAGLRVLDISGIDTKSILEEGFFDTHPTTDLTAFEGVWNVYPFFASGKIVISDINRGLFVVKKAN